MTESPPSTDPIEVELTGMAHGGEAVGRHADGRVVFVAGGVPPERATTRLTEMQDRFARGYLAAPPATPSADRTEPRCMYYGEWPGRGEGTWCGACQWQHISYEAQLRHKTMIVRDALGRIGRLDAPNVHECVGMDDPWAYRNQVRLVAINGGLGYRPSAGENVVPITSCPIAHPLVEGLIEEVEGLEDGVEVVLRAGIRTGQRMVALHTTPEAIGGIEVDLDASVALVAADGEAHVVAGEPFFAEVVADRTFLVPPAGFFQVNTVMADVLVKLVRDGIGDRVRRLVDLHSGVGLFAVLLADLGEEVYAVERHGPSIAAAVENSAGLDHVTLVEASAREGLSYLDMGVDAVVLDPPRGGVDRGTMRLLVKRAPHTIVYVSCEPSTLARDARALTKAGWQLESSQPVDLFPHTFHVESVNVFRR